VDKPGDDEGESVVLGALPIPGVGDAPTPNARWLIVI
jgi:hypothetical protein